MVQVRKLVLAIAAASALSSGMAQALGLGELTLKSTLNQPLLAEIELLDVKDLTAAQVVPSLAPAQDFSNEGVPRPAFLEDLRFTPVINADGKSVLRVTSSQPLSEPFVKFLVQVMWPNGRLLRDYSVLLDPAKFSPQTAAAAASAPASASAEPGQYTTTARDTLWEIAAKARNGGSVQQTMLAIQALNPDAFINGNINRLKTGQVLRLPDATQSVQLAQAKAVNEVASQNADWRNGRRTVPLAQQLDATGRQPARPPVAKTPTRDGLSLVSGQAGKAAGKGNAGDASQVNDKLAVAQEGLDSTRRENVELQSRMQDLQSQLDKLQRLIDLKNNQLARLEAGSEAPVDPAVAIAAAPGVQPADSPEADIAPALEGVPATAVAPAPVESTAAPSVERKIQDLLGSPLLLGLVGGAAVLMLLLLLLLVRRRKALLASQRHERMARDLEEESGFAMDLDMPPSSFEGLETPSRSVTLEPAPASVVHTVAPVAAPVSLSKPRPAADVQAEAQHLIEQRQLREAEALLRASIDQAPDRCDLRLRLMEVYGELGEREAFVAQERQLVANGKNHTEVEQLKKQYPAMLAGAAGIATAAVATQLQAQFVQEMMRDDREVEPEPETAPPVEAFDHDFDLSLDELEAASPAEVPSQPVLDKPAADSFEAVLEQQAQVQSAHEDVTDFDLDLPADFDLSLADESAPAPAAPDSFSLELDKVNAELQRLSQSMEESSLAQPFADDEPEFDFLSGADETATKLDLAQAYIDMGDDEGARDILTEVMEEGNPQQQAEALEMISRLT
ncbi:FimV/HubP family polar landmark protein [Pseudomonas deceptionensis]|uniref:Pilus assembly protein FimV n=1 Tax=Pseudomonas deceptionensis TaxID=882211 RepID=A0A0J6GGL4_PSEDM|nr:FimV/HubP family polar landmark protein [Pseudomonas deceptionensis]KMM80825.1 peptidoglycan-binding protein [Pseudomonas deceptionensis]SEE89919.1 pilus assembly protein FimV [Pseudomonas deceptionensis]